MGLRKRFRDFRDWCLQPPDRMPSRLKRYSMPIVAALSVTLILSVSFFVLSSNVLSSPPVPIFQTSAPTWYRQTVSTDDSFGGTYMALDSNNNPHITYTGANGEMYYASWVGSNWKIQGVILGGSPISLVLDSHNDPHILFKGANGVTYYASGNGNGTNWIFLSVPAGGNGYSLALDSKGNPHIAYLSNLPVREYPQGVTNDISMLSYASWNGSNWNIQTVDAPVSDSGSVYLQLNSNNNPIIMYGYDPGSSFTPYEKFAIWNGSNWNIQTPFTNLDSYGNMVLDSNGYPDFIYQTQSNYSSSLGYYNSSLTYASWSGSAWNTQIVVTNCSSSNPTLALDSHNYPHIEFFNGSLIYASWTGASWNIQTVAPNNFAYGEGSLALDSSGNPHICYLVDDIQDKTAFVSSLIYTAQTPLSSPSPSLPTPFNTIYIIVGIFVAIVIVAAAVFLTFRKRLKTKPANPLTEEGT
jgi:hypothetical protein